MRSVYVLAALLCFEGIFAELSTDYKEAILDKHNDLRRKQKASNMDKLEWDDSLAQKADTWIKACNMAHENAGFGENLGFVNIVDSSVTNYTQAMDGIMQEWYNEIKTYRGGLCGNSCHYTQMVWYKTREIGCAHRVCQKMRAFGNAVKSVKPSLFFACWYSPRGNWENQPFKVGAPCSNCTRANPSCEGGLCSGGQEKCQDLNGQCRAFKELGQCASNKVWMDQNCKLSCGCPAGSLQIKTECKDKSPDCARFKKPQCKMNPTWMYDNCAKFCDQC